MNVLPAPTPQELKQFQEFQEKEKYIVRFKKFHLNEQNEKYFSEITQYGFFTSEEEAKNHFLNVVIKDYIWKGNHFVLEFLCVMKLNEFKKQNKKKGK